MVFMSRVQEPVEAFISRTGQQAEERRIARSNQLFTGILAGMALFATCAVALIAIEKSRVEPITVQDIQDAANCAAAEAGGQVPNMAPYVQECESDLGLKLGDQFDYTVSIANSLVQP